MANFTDNEKTVLQELRRYQEGDIGNGFASVYLENCKQHGTKSFSGTLASLEKKGFYQRFEDNDTGFGKVKLEQCNNCGNSLFSHESCNCLDESYLMDSQKP